MATRVTQQFIQYVADPSSASDVRLTRLFAQVAVKAGGNVFAVNQKIFDKTGTPVVIALEDFFYETVVMSLFSSGGADATYDPVFNVTVNMALFKPGNGMTVEALYEVVSHQLFAGGAGSQAVPDEYREIVHYLGFTERTILPIGNHIGFSGIVSEAQVVSAANYLFQNPEVNNRVVRAYNVGNSLSFVDTAILQTTKNIGNSLGFVSAFTIDPSTQFGQIVTEGNFLRQTISLEIDDTACREREYAPLIGSDTSDEFEDLATAPPTVVSSNSITLEYPETSPTHTLSLLPPNFGNVNGVSFTRIDRRTRGNDRKIFSDPKWATWERLRLDFEGNSAECNATFDDILDFLNASLNGKIKITDHESRVWVGKIIAPETAVSEEQAGFRFSILFEGDIQTFEVQYGELGVEHGDPGSEDDVVYEE